MTSTSPLPASGTARARSRARTRAKVLEAAQQHIAAGVTELPLNTLAREAGVGVGTVYRHFPTSQSLLEAASMDSFTALVTEARRATAEPDPAIGLRALIRFALQQQLDDSAFACVLAAPTPGPDIAALGAELARLADDLLARAHHTGTVRTDVNPAILQRLVCGLHHAVTTGQRTPHDVELFVDLVMSAIRPPRAERSSRR